MVIWKQKLFARLMDEADDGTGLDKSAGGVAADEGTAEDPAAAAASAAGLSVDDYNKAVARGDIIVEEAKPADDKKADDAASATEKEAADKAAAEAAAAEAAKKAEADKGEKDKKGEKEEKGEEPFIPKSRFDQVNNERKEAMKKLAELEGTKQNVDKTAELVKASDEAWAKYDEAMLSGDKAAAAAARATARQAEMALSDYRAQVNAAAQQHQFELTQHFNNALSKIEADYPELNPDTEHHNAEIEKEVTELMNAYSVAHNMPMHEALKKAVALVASAKGLKPLAQRAAESKATEEKSAAAKAIEEAEKKAEEAQKLAAARKAEANQRGVEASKRQPPDASKGGVGGSQAGMNDAKDVVAMSDKQREKLKSESPDAYARARGDFVE